MGAKKKPDITPAFTGRDVPINEIAQGIGKSADFIKRGLRTGALDFGYAVKSDNSDRYGYYCALINSFGIKQVTQGYNIGLL